MIIMKVNINIFSLIMFWIIIHLGKNPKNGGKPPKDRKLIINENFNDELFILINNCFKKKIFKFFINKTNRIVTEL